MKRVLCVYLSISLFMMSVHAQSAFNNINFKYDYLKLTKVSGPGKMMVEKCNKAHFERLPHPDKPGKKKRTAVRSKERRFQCEPITGNWDKTCFDFVPRSEAERESEELGTDSTLLGLIFFPFLFLGAGELNHANFLKTIRESIENLDSEKLYIGISKSDQQLLQINSEVYNTGKYEGKELSTYTNPYKVGVWDESKFVRKLNLGIMQRTFIQKVTVDSQEIEKEYQADLSCQ